MPDYRIEPPRHTRGEQLASAWDAVSGHVISLKGLWPTPADYAQLPRTWRRDLMAGLTVGIVALPLALGFGVASGMGATAGLVTAIIAGIVAAVFGGSHLQVSGPTGAMTVVLLPVIAAYGVESVPALAILAGIMVILMGMTALGRSVDLIPLPVVEGFTAGIGVIIFLQQLPLVLGSEKGEGESSLVSAWNTIAGTDWAAAVAPLAIMALVVALHLVGERVARGVPLSLVAIIVATVVAELMSLDVARIGALPTSLPAPSLPSFDWRTIQGLAAPALAVAALAALESLLSARVADGMVPDVTRTNPDRELVGQGLANVASGLFGGLPATGAIARTAVNARTGGRTRLAVVFHAVVLLGVMVFASPIVARIPMAALGGVLVMTALRMVSLKALRPVMAATRADRNTLLLTFAATVVLDLVMAVLLGFAMAAVMSLRHMASYSAVFRQHLPADTREGWIDLLPEQESMRHRIAIYRVDGALFYGDARRFVEEIEAVEDGVDAVIVRCHRMNVFDASGAEALADVARALARRGVGLVVQGMTPSQVQTALLMVGLPADRYVRELSRALDIAVGDVRARDADPAGGRGQ
ncbi:SulP family inorganic anion transporter [Propioniciclava sp. MC1683]|uniref:SulP family inorganic anion transporter n=1 Tax=Propioniciclava sp. MC1683 TaxID=2760309 RepID=UPI001600519B|nr:SulP family inorganic anion transporter [Propioniciclava sp. MC1683]MBB1500851.1 SulP family inorganic anion transporter [Propioniciclava sp. MC1683]